MLFQYSHNHGLKYDKSGGDSLIKINQRSISNDVTNLIEEILNAPNIQEELIEPNQPILNKHISKPKSLDSTSDLDQPQTLKSTVQLIDTDHIEAISLAASTPNAPESSNSINNLTSEFSLINELNQSSHEQEFLTEMGSSLKMREPPASNNTKIEFKDCCVYLRRMDDMLVESYLNKFELKYNSNEAGYSHMAADIVSESEASSSDEGENVEGQLSLIDLPDENELYSDEFGIMVSDRRRMSFDEAADVSLKSNEENMKDTDSVSESLDESEINENDEDCYTCELCPENDRCSYKHLTQLKVSFWMLFKNKVWLK